jgi:hypothetical protein
MAVVTHPEPTGASEPRFARKASQASIELYWLPLGAGGWLVRLNGRIYEAIHALLERRRPLDLYHSALIVRVPEGRFVIEDAWPIPDAVGASRGVAVEGPVASRRMARFRVFRYEVRRWRDGVIADADEAVASPQLLSDDLLRARRLLDLVGSLPRPVWGRDELGTGEMWNSNSVISWLLARSGLPTDAIRPPAGGRAPGWEAGLVTARRPAAEQRAGRVRCGGVPAPWEGGVATAARCAATADRAGSLSARRGLRGVRADTPGRRQGSRGPRSSRRRPSPAQTHGKERRPLSCLMWTNLKGSGQSGSSNGMGGSG